MSNGSRRFHVRKCQMLALLVFAGVRGRVECSNVTLCVVTTSVLLAVGSRPVRLIPAFPPHSFPERAARRARRASVLAHVSLCGASAAPSVEAKPPPRRQCAIEHSMLQYRALGQYEQAFGTSSAPQNTQRRPSRRISSSRSLSQSISSSRATASARPYAAASMRYLRARNSSTESVKSPLRNISPSSYCATL
jgi:hypothetical protein